MIGKLSGILDTIESTYVIIDVQGVGYLVHTSQRALRNIGQQGDPVAFFIQTLVREDAITLYGFTDRAEQDWFRLLTTVQGVGAKAALAILSVAPPEKIELALAAQDKDIFRQADGVGPKLASRIVTELKDKAVSINLSLQNAIPAGAAHLDVQEQRQLDDDAVSALINLGYARSEAFTAVLAAKSKANDNDRNNLQAVIRLSLKQLARTS